MDAARVKTMQKISFWLLILSPFAARADGLLGTSNPADMAGGHGVSAYVGGHYFVGDDYMAVAQFSGNWNGSYTPKNGMNLAMLNGRLEAGATYDSWRVAALYRKELLIESNRDTTDAVYYNKRGIAVSPGRTFNLNLGVEGFAADGVRLDKGFVLPAGGGKTLSLGAGVSLLRGISVRIGTVVGTAASTPTGYSYDATLADNNNSRPTYLPYNPFLGNAAPAGLGYALDAGAKLEWADGARLELAANDLAGLMRWDNITYLNATANSSTLVISPSGWIYNNPPVAGVEYKRTFTEPLPTKLHTQYTRPLANLDVFAGTDWERGYWFPQAGITYHLNPDWKMTLAYDVRFGTLDLGIAHKWGYLDLRSNNVSLGQAQAYGLAGGINIPF
jgi:hypothetical protein